MQDVLNHFGIDQSTIQPFSSDPNDLVLLREIYETTVAAMKGSATVSKEEISKLKDSAKNNPKAIEMSNEALSNIRELAYNTFDSNNDTLVFLVEGLEEFVSILKQEMKDWIDGKTNSVTKKSSTEQAERFSQALGLRKLIESLWTMKKANLNLTEEVFREDGQFPLKDTKGDGLAPSLSRLPHDPRKKSTSTANRGRPVHSKNLRFEWNGKTLPPGTLGTEVAKNYISDRKNGVSVSWKDIRESVENLGKNLSKDTWELSFKTGTLRGFVEDVEDSSPKKK